METIGTRTWFGSIYIYIYIHTHIYRGVWKASSHVKKWVVRWMMFARRERGFVIKNERMNDIGFGSTENSYPRPG